MLALRSDVRFFDMVRRDAAVQKQKLLEFLQMLDIWDLRSFKSQGRKQRAWNAATRLLPCLTWIVKYNPRKQLAKDLAAGVAVSFLIVPQARSSAAQRVLCHTLTPPRCAQGLSYAGVAGLPAIHGLCARPLRSRRFGCF
jgi:hypothetical protein